MLIDDIRKANVEAMKAHDAAARSSLSQIISRYTELKTNGSGKEVTDADVVKVIVKYDKELDEERASYVQANRPDSVKEIDAQKAVLVKFLPKLMSEDEVRKIYATLADKSMPSVMKYFKANYDGKVDMSLVSKIARGL
jgi:uncharacterized protein YqeY